MDHSVRSSVKNYHLILFAVVFPLVFAPLISAATFFLFRWLFG